MPTTLYNAILADTPLGYWPMTEPSGTFADVSGSGLTATPSGGLTLAGGLNIEAQPCPLWDSQSLDSASFTRQAGPSNTGQVFSGGAWIKTTSADSSVSYAGNPALTVLGDTASAIGQAFGVHAGKVRYTLYSSGWQYLDSARSVNDDQWHYISFSYTGAAGAGGAIVYVDGVADNNANFNPSAGGASAGFNAIGFSFSGDGFLGNIAHAWIKKAVVAPDRMRGHYHAGSRVGVIVG